MNYYSKQFFEDYQDIETIKERYQEAINRIKDISLDEVIWQDYKSYFDKVSEFIIYVDSIFNLIISGDYKKADCIQLEKINNNLYSDILPDNYDNSYGNPAFAEKMLNEYGQALSFLYTEIRGLITYAFEGRILEMAINLELFLEIYGMFKDEELPKLKFVKEALYYHMYDYADITVFYRVRETLDPSLTFAKDIIMDSNLDDIKYLYSYGEFITENEIATARFLSKKTTEEIDEMAKTYTEGFKNGFKTMGVDLKPKKSVCIRYSIGQERIVKEAINQFQKMGLAPIIFRYSVSRVNRKLTNRVGYTSTPANKQYEYDHRMDEAIFWDKSFIERKLSVLSTSYETYKNLAKEYAGPAVIEVFGEEPFSPVIKKEALKLDQKQQELMVSYTSKSTQIVNTFIPRDQYSFTIIAYPIKEIGQNFEEIFEEIIKVNTLDNELYTNIQQAIINQLDKADYIHVIGAGNNKTDIKVMLYPLKDANKETKFENCVADVNIPVGEVFTSPVLKGTNGTLHVSEVYLHDLKYKDLCITFFDGKIVDYTCSNFDKEEDNKAFIKENLLYNQETLPIGEFAIGTNTTAYVMSKKYGIVNKLPILIVEKMGPHFAVGDTCYSYSEDKAVFNPDGKEIVARDNECSMLRNEDITKAYFNCHTDITIPYDEISGIYAVSEAGEKIAIIEDGRFVLEGSEELNKAFETI